MKLLFIQGGSRWKFDDVGNVYSDSNFNEKIWDRYYQYCNDLTVVLRREDKIYLYQEAKERFNIFNKKKMKFVAIPDLYRPIKNVFNLKMRNEIEHIIDEQVKGADKVIIRSLGNIYTNTALKYAYKYKKPYLVEVTGFAWESLWYHSIRGKIVAGIKEYQCKKMMKNVPYAVYVTEGALQKRYPCTGKTLGCSDVELAEVEETVLQNRLQKIREKKDRIVIGTAAFLDVKWKGQKYVIKAIAELKKRGYEQFEYHLIGSGDGKQLKKIINKLALNDCVQICGQLPHEQVFQWLDSIDIYVQSSFMEGLCRSVVEAMSRACPVIASDVGGNYELVSKEYLFDKANYKQLADRLIKLACPEMMLEEAKRSFDKAKEYRTSLLDKSRDTFYQEFIEA